MNPYFLKADELTRRQFMIHSARAYLGVNLFPMLGSSLASAAPDSLSPTGKAKNIIYLFMSGGMSHLDTFDPKLNNKTVMGGTEVISSNVDEIKLGSHLPMTSQVADKLCLINSLTTTQGAHEHGTYHMHTSYTMRGSIVHPSLGSWVTKLAGKLHPELPNYVAINSNPNVTGGGFFGSKYSAVAIGKPEQGINDSKRFHRTSETDFSRRIELTNKLNKEFQNTYPNSKVCEYQDLYQSAISLLNSKDLKAFNIQEEDQETHRQYGNTTFAQGCLLARRLVEHGVRFVEVNLGGWDTHENNFEGVADQCLQFDQAYAALLLDLEKRNMLKDTLVVVATEFGRTPTITSGNEGRNHHPKAFSCVLAGGGVKGGIRYGQTDEEGNEIVKHPVSVQDFNATIAHSLGLPRDLVIMSPTKRPFKIADKGVPIESIFA